MFSPPRMMTSLVRPEIFRYPSGSMRAMSPVSNHLPSNSSRVISSRLAYPANRNGPVTCNRPSVSAGSTVPASSTTRIRIPGSG